MDSDRYELRNLATAPASDDSLVDALIAFVNGADLIICGQKSRFGEPHSKAVDRPIYSALLQAAIDGEPSILPMLTDKEGHQRPVFAVISLGLRNDALPEPIRGIASVSVSRVLLARPQGYSLGYFRQFRTARAALAEATVLTLDPARPYARKLCRCKYPDCQKFYFAEKNLRGGPPNRIYCTPKHRKLHNNSALRKQSS